MFCFFGVYFCFSLVYSSLFQAHLVYFRETKVATLAPTEAHTYSLEQNSTLIMGCWALRYRSTVWSLAYIDQVFAMASRNVAYDKKRKSKAKWENDFLSAEWLVMDGIESAHCKLCPKLFRPKKKLWDGMRHLPSTSAMKNGNAVSDTTHDVSKFKSTFFADDTVLFFRKIGHRSKKR